MYTLLNEVNFFTHHLTSFFAVLNLALLLTLIYFNRESIEKFLSKIDKKTWILLLLIFILALTIRIIIPSHAHSMYIDEPQYMEAAKNILKTGSQEGYQRAIGWPTILAASFSIFGVNNWVAIYVSMILGSLTIFNIFFLTMIITDNKHASLLAALILSLFTSHIRWSTTAETNVPTLFFIILTLFFYFLYYKHKKRSLLWLSLISTAFTVQFRPENIIFPALFLLGSILYDKKNLIKLNIKYIVPWIVLIILALPNTIQVLNWQLPQEWVKSDTGGESTGNNFGVNNLLSNTMAYGRYFFDDTFQPVFFTMIAVIGLIYAFTKEKRKGLFLVGWFFLLWLAYFFAYFQTLGGGFLSMHKARFFMMFHPIETVFMCYGIIFINNLIKKRLKRKYTKLASFAVILILLISFVPYVIKAKDLFFEPEARLETRIPEIIKKDIPHDCTLVMVHPVIITSTTDFNVISADSFLKNNEESEPNFENCILFFEEMYCKHGYQYEKALCTKIKQEYNLKLFRSYSYEDITDNFYRITAKKQDK